jgi:hypothetical protein
LLPSHNAVTDRNVELWQHFHERKPARGDVLLWHPADPVGYHMQKLGNGKCRVWCDLFEIEAPRGVVQHDWTLKEENAPEFDALPEEEQLSHLGQPSPNAQHLFSKKPSKWKQNRVNKLLAALDEYQDRCGALTAEMGLQEADDLAEESHDQIMGILERIEGIKPETLRGLQVKAKMLLNWYWEDHEVDDHDPGQATALEIINGWWRPTWLPNRPIACKARRSMPAAHHCDHPGGRELCGRAAPVPPSPARSGPAPFTRTLAASGRPDRRRVFTEAGSQRVYPPGAAPLARLGRPEAWLTFFR